MIVKRSVEEDDVVIRDGRQASTPTLISTLMTSTTMESQYTTAVDDSVWTSDGITWAAIGGVFCVVVFLVATLQYLRKRQQTPKAKKKRRLKKDMLQKAKEEKHIADVSRDPIPVDLFPDILRQKNKNVLLQIEFKALSRLQEEYTSEDAYLPENRCKNDYNEVLPDDNNRVLLEPIQGQLGSDYINATYIDGYKKVKAYIATQGPKAQTVNDFWRMVCQEGAHCIVMATNLFEHARSEGNSYGETQQCEKYWHNTYQRYGSTHVILEETETTADFTVRTFRISEDGNNDERLVKQFQLNSWNEHDCPDPSAVLEYRRRIKAFTKSKTGPIVVHCSNGAGRTGTFIAIDILLERMCMEDTLDVFNCVLALRNARTEMVANMQQYMFIFECISMHIQCGVTVIQASELSGVVQKLLVKDPQTKLSGMDKEMKILDMVVPKLQVGECAGGHRLENRRKSRDIMIQPPERARPYLITFDSSDSSDFINACYVDSYRRQNAFIITQWPSKNTTNDIWRLIFDYHITTVVMLNDMPESKSYPRFWPEQFVGEWERYGPINVSYQGIQAFPNITARTFHVKKKKIYVNIGLNLGEAGEALANPLGNIRKGRLLEDEAKIVQIFQLTCWPNNQKVPSDSHALMELMNMVENWQQVAADRNSPICVISKNGVSRVGLYCAISYTCEKLRLEGEADIFHAVKVIKTNRTQLVENMAEYIYCYTFCVRMIDWIMAQRQQLEARKSVTPRVHIQKVYTNKPVKKVVPKISAEPLQTSTPECKEVEKSLADYKGFDHYSFIAQRVEEYRRTQKERAQHTAHVHYNLPNPASDQTDYANDRQNWRYRNGNSKTIETPLDPSAYRTRDLQDEVFEDDSNQFYAGGRKFDHYFERNNAKDPRTDSYASYAMAHDGKRDSIADPRRASYVGSNVGTDGYYSCDSRRSSYASAFDSSERLNNAPQNLDHPRSRRYSGGVHDPDRISISLASDSRRSSYAMPKEGGQNVELDHRRLSYASTHYLFDYYHNDSPYAKNNNNNYIRHNDIYSDPVLQSKVQNCKSYAYYNEGQRH